MRGVGTFGNYRTRPTDQGNERRLQDHPPEPEDLYRAGHNISSGTIGLRAVTIDGHALDPKINKPFTLSMPSQY